MDRITREEGSTIELGGTVYRISSVEGMGASAIAYRAEYEDALSEEFSHHVYIKELFPVTPHGEIYRDEAGNICCTADGIPLFENFKQRFEEGNRANLTLLASRPDRVSGNLNSYKAYGTYYSVLSVHGGENLQTLLDQGNINWSLAEIISIINKLLDALECFHRSGYLHLDISPDNILLLRYQALLIDYNSIWDTRDTNGRGFSFSEKEGYSAPEISLRRFSDISAATDLYSVCAVFFRMVAGRPLSEWETMGNGLKHCFAQGFSSLDEEPESVRYKVCRILARGLHTLPRKRYQDISQLRSDLAMLEQMISTPELMAKDNDELYDLVYDNLLASLHDTEQEGKAVLARQKKHQKILRAVSVLLIICLLCGIAAVSKSMITGSTSGYTEEERQTIDRMITCLEANVNSLCIQISSQQTVLDEALSSDVIAGNPDALAELDELINNRKAYIDSQTSVSLSDDLLEDLIAINPDFPTDELGELSRAPGEMKSVAAQALSELSDMIGENGTYSDESDRREVVELYQNYLDLYTAWLFYEFDYVLIALEADDISTILYESQYDSLFAEYYNNFDLTNQDAGTVYGGMNNAAQNLWSAQLDMTAAGYDINWN